MKRLLQCLCFLAAIVVGMLVGFGSMFLMLILFGG